MPHICRETEVPCHLTNFIKSIISCYIYLSAIHMYANCGVKKTFRMNTFIYIFFEYARIFMKISLFISFYCGFLLLILLLLLRLLIYHLLVICCSFYYCKLLFAVHFLGRRILLRSFMFRTNRRRRKNEDIIQYHSYGNT